MKASASQAEQRLWGKHTSPNVAMAIWLAMNSADSQRVEESKSCRAFALLLIFARPELMFSADIFHPDWMTQWIQVIAVQPLLCSVTVAQTDVAMTFKVSVRHVSLRAIVQQPSGVLLKPSGWRAKLPVSLFAFKIHWNLIQPGLQHPVLISYFCAFFFVFYCDSKAINPAGPQRPQLGCKIIKLTKNIYISRQR